MPSNQTAKSWEKFFVEYFMAKNYKFPHMLASGFGITPNNPILDSLLPTLLFINMVSVFDEAMDEYMENNGLTLPPGYKNTFKGKIDYFRACNLLNDYAAVDRIRGIRNEIAHESNRTIDWKTLDDQVLIIEKELKKLNFIQRSPDLDLNGERSAAATSKDPAYKFERTYTIVVKDKPTNQVVLEMSWGEKFGGAQ